MTAHTHVRITVTINGKRHKRFEGPAEEARAKARAWMLRNPARPEDAGSHVELSLDRYTPSKPHIAPTRTAGAWTRERSTQSGTISPRAKRADP